MVVHGQPALQQAIRWNLFQVAQATARAEQSGVPAKGVTGSGYGGHYFWDTEIYVLPFLTYTSPQMARSALRFRYNMLDAARRRAAGPGAERRAVPVADGQRRGGVGLLRGRHRAVPHRRRHRVRAVQVRERERRPGVHEPRGRRHPGRDRADVGRPRLLAGAHGGGGTTFHVHGVTGPDEYTTVVNDNLFTNVMARFNLAQGGRGGAAAGARTCRCAYRAGGRAAGRSSRTRSTSGPPAPTAMAIPYDDGDRDQPAGLPLPGPRGLGPGQRPRRRSGRCCCTTTRW